jgi:CMP-N,N'-diacetyllegionaminic acid synthase
MIDGRRVLAVVPARGGSKGVPLKNVRLVHGVPLLALTAKTVERCPFIDRAVVSTDSTDIADVARKHGLDVPFTRPERLSGDLIGDWDVLEHALGEMERIDATTYDVVLMLQPTSPLRTPEQLSRVLDTLVSGRLDSVWTVSETDVKFHPLKQLTLVDGRLDHFDPRGQGVIARQQLGKVYHRNGVAYAMTRECLVEQKKLLGERAGAVVVTEPVVNIDTLDDFEKLERLLAKRDQT